MQTGLLFSGQGSQRAAMGAPWQRHPAWELVDRIADASGHDVVDLLLKADDDSLRRTDRAQIATFALEMIVLAAHRARGHEAESAYAGHSLGEYSALVAAGVLDLHAGARLVAARGAAMLAAADADPGTMVAVVGTGADQLEEAIAQLRASGARVWIANDNAPGQTTLAGDKAGIALARDAGVGKVLPLPVGGAFHSPMMAPAEAALRTALTETDFGDASAPVVANVDARPHVDAADWSDLLARQLTAPVRWTESVRTLIDELGCDEFIEIGPGNTLANMVKRIDKGVPCRAVSADDY
jgi:[acyl-carrier-protein] S-malonyltransferase